MTQNPWGPSAGHEDHPEHDAGWGHRAESGQAWAGQPQQPTHASSATYPPADRPGPTRFPQPSAAVRPPQPQQQWGTGQWSAPLSQGPQTYRPQQPYAPQAAPNQQWRQPAGQAPYGTFSAPYQPRPTQQQPAYVPRAYPPPTGVPYRPQPYSGQQTPWGYYPPAPPPRRRSPLGPILGALAAVVVLAVLALTFVIASSPHPRNDHSPSPSASAAPKWIDNEYQVPDADPNPSSLPQPNSDDEAKQWMTDNALYGQAVAIPIRCDVKDIDQLHASDTELEDHINDVVGCLVHSWHLPVTDSGFELFRPTVTVYDGSVETRCGKEKGGNAFYCGGDQQIYYANDLSKALPENIRGHRWTAESIVAHEFGHAVQGRVGILVSDHYAQTTSWGKADKNEWNRRLELQADCFAGAFLQSVSLSMAMTPEDIRVIKAMFHEFGDDVQSGKADYDGNHGLGANREYWVNEGLNAKTLASCNTFTAPSDQVR